MLTADIAVIEAAFVPDVDFGLWQGAGFSHVSACTTLIVTREADSEKEGRVYKGYAFDAAGCELLARSPARSGQLADLGRWWRTKARREPPGALTRALAGKEANDRGGGP